MIQGYFRDKLKAKLPVLDWYENYYTYRDDESMGCVFSEGGANGDKNSETEFMFPAYQVLIRSTDYDQAEVIAETVKSIFDRNHGVTYTTDKEGETYTYQIYFIQADGVPNRLGVENGLMEYTVNFTATIRRAN